MNGPLRTRLRLAISRFVRVVGRLGAPESPWDRVALRVPPTAFGPGSQHQFDHYFEGESRVTVESIDEMAEWLLACQYVSDRELFKECERWQHPTAFEELRRGDCEDFALWAWRKMVDAGIEAEFHVGRVRLRDKPPGGGQHAWVVYRVDGVAFLFEPAARSREAMIQSLDEAMDDYVPHFAVDHRLRTFAFALVTSSAQPFS